MALREQLHVMMAASVSAVDGGEAFHSMDKSLAPPGRPRPRPAEGEAGKAPKAEVLSAKEKAHADAAFEAAMAIWGEI